MAVAPVYRSLRPPWPRAIVSTTLSSARLPTEGPRLSDPLLWHRLQFAFTIVFHYLFPQLTMGLALLIVVMKTMGLRTGDSRWNDAARFWIRIFGVNFAVGVVTGIPMEFQFGTNWALDSPCEVRHIPRALLGDDVTGLRVLGARSRGGGPSRPRLVA
jgi:hypothetical protein